MSLSALFAKQTNHLTLVRLVLSLMVIYSHCHPLGNFGSEMFGGFGNDKYGNLAVNAFFVISGLLITRSFASSRRPSEFLLRRVLRIFPGFWGALLVCAFLIGPLIYVRDHQTLSGYGSSPDSPWTYVVFNLPLRISQPNLRDLFSRNPYAGMVNGSLWTLIYEFGLYLLVLALGCLGLLRKHPVWWLVLGLLCVANIFVGLDLIAPFPLQKHIEVLCRFTAYFLAGSLAHLYGDALLIRRSGTLVTTAIFLLLCLCPFKPVEVLYYLLMPPILVRLIFGWAFWGDVPQWEARMPDISYGVYIYGWPVQQSLVALHFASSHFGTYLAASWLMAMLFALPSYLLIEKPCLSLKRRWR